MDQHHLFTKVLSPVDTTHRLTVPTANLGDFEFPAGQHAINIEATDTIEQQWTFKLSIRRNDHPKPKTSIYRPVDSICERERSEGGG
ncbi:hypothetical protein OIU85_026941 [Salix viminalis]|uniref:Uncharacterized protein n=1 Tax=Salix viminalis TaxID=40686 RepID=A0A9Q0TPM3_SALVM|nr:hypothetical protein OIU85_026941 [Salix viminalis]